MKVVFRLAWASWPLWSIYNWSLSLSLSYTLYTRLVSLLYHTYTHRCIDATWSPRLASGSSSTLLWTGEKKRLPWIWLSSSMIYGLLVSRASLCLQGSEWPSFGPLPRTYAFYLPFLNFYVYGLQKVRYALSVPYGKRIWVCPVVGIRRSFGNSDGWTIVTLGMNLLQTTNEEDPTRKLIFLVCGCSPESRWGTPYARTQVAGIKLLLIADVIYGTSHKYCRWFDGYYLNK